MNDPLTIVGGGITGLTAAYLAARAGRRVCVLEAGENLGGLLGTFPVGGNRLEYFYHHFFTHDAEILWLFKELGLSDRILWRKTKMGFYRRGKIYPFSSPLDLIRFEPVSLSRRIRFALTSLYLSHFADWTRKEDVSALEWFYRRAGWKVTTNIWKPLLDIKFGRHAAEVPLSWMIGRMRQRAKSRRRGVEYLGYLDGSLHLLLERLTDALDKMGVELQPRSPVRKLLIDHDELQGVETPGNAIVGGQFLFTIPTPALAGLLEWDAPEYAARLRQIEYFGAVCVVLEMDRSLGPWYWLNVADPGFPFGGVIEHTRLVSREKYNGKHLVYLSRYFTRDEDIADMTKEKIASLMMDKLRLIYPDFSIYQIEKTHVFKTFAAAPVCDLRFSRKVPDCQSPIRNLYLANMTHVYPDERSVNNAIRVAAQAAKILGIPADYVPQNASLAGKIGFGEKWVP
ncbi:MAG: NAD(P)/FAD-dependent oxidoreductase [Bacteroidetes bacterium]|nr:MAG: NAD(P)/FAD-dependent oxidoreductase [Bacteroidota bacterium]